ncbi:MAG: indole-3-glycerol phosphate synthase TrpC [Cyclobacteriaceae bacterium]|jgi:indole-3-glycerol phosphate synthase|nr:indole-3-glycerol phosphate synthase TrpC [Cyclobacteriaceae bacterium]
MDILDEIIANKHQEVAERKELFPLRLLERSLYFESPTVSLRKYVTRPDKSGIIAEIKRKSPSKGAINPHISVEKVSIGYMQAGASALSVLTDTPFFGGSNDDLTTARKFNFCPILRKDFVVDEYQIVEAKSIGADAILLIAASLSPGQIRTFAELAHRLGMEVLLEVHSKEELQRNQEAPVDLMGVNNRDLKTFRVDVTLSKELAAAMPRGTVAVSESGLDSPQAVADLMAYGYQGFLIGQRFMETAQPEKAARVFIQELKKIKSPVT